MTAHTEEEQISPVGFFSVFRNHTGINYSFDIYSAWQQRRHRGRKKGNDNEI